MNNNKWEQVLLGKDKDYTTKYIDEQMKGMNFIGESADTAFKDNSDSL